VGTTAYYPGNLSPPLPLRDLEDRTRAAIIRLQRLQENVWQFEDTLLAQPALAALFPEGLIADLNRLIVDAIFAFTESLWADREALRLH
jgi:hypothetical protein